MIKVLLIIPAYNEEENIVSTIDQIKAYKASSANMDFVLDYIVINDGSSDRTCEVCKNHGINVINLGQNLGIGAAVQTGYKYARLKDYDIAVQFDGDGQHDIESLESVIGPIVEDRANLTIGSRFVEDHQGFKSSAMRRFGINFLSTVMSIFIHDRIYDVTSGYRAADKTVIGIFAADYPYDYPEPESIVRIKKMGYKVEEVPANMFKRQAGQSSITPLKSFYYMIKVTIAIIIAGIQTGEDR